MLINNQNILAKPAYHYVHKNDNNVKRTVD